MCPASRCWLWAGHSSRAVSQGPWFFLWVSHWSCLVFFTAWWLASKGVAWWSGQASRDSIFPHTLKVPFTCVPLGKHFTSPGILKSKVAVTSFQQTLFWEWWHLSLTRLRKFKCLAIQGLIWNYIIVSPSDISQDVWTIATLFWLLIVKFFLIAKADVTINNISVSLGMRRCKNWNS